MRKISILFCYLSVSLIFTGLSQASPDPIALQTHYSNPVTDKEWDAFKHEYNKKYRDREEEAYRRGIYNANKVKVQKLNLEQMQTTGEMEEVFGVTKYFDLSEKEFADRYLTPKMAEYLPDDIAPATPIPTNFSQLPTDFSWVTQGATTPVKNQRSCGSCWAFSATEMIESMAFLATRTLPILAPQQMVSCDRSNSGCRGGWPSKAFDYVKRYGQEQEVDYPYTATNSSCTYNAAKVKAHVTGWKYIIPKCSGSSCSSNEPALKTYTATTGPSSIAVNASSWQFYRSGILASSCSNSSFSLNHAVQLVGYGVSGSTSYWTVRNSWGPNWGESGYIRLVMDKNICGLADVVTTPLGASVT